jgi:preprotein translocase subunit SecG
MSAMAMTSNLPAQRKPAFLTYFLGIVFVTFIGILIFVYVVTKHTNPVMLDQNGKPVAAEPAHDHAGH